MVVTIGVQLYRGNIEMGSVGRFGLRTGKNRG
jgi:hypothetical protein